MPPYTVGGQYASSGSGIATLTQATAASSRYASNNTPPGNAYASSGGHYGNAGGGQYPSRVHSPAQSNLSQQQQQQHYHHGQVNMGLLRRCICKTNFKLVLG